MSRTAMLPENVSTMVIGGGRVETEQLLFQIAIHYAEQGLAVWFISSQPFAQLPEGVKPPDKEVLQLITFLYLKDQRDLLLHLNGIHVWHKMPQLLIVNGFDQYCSLKLPNYDLVDVAFTVASLIDATAACAQKCAVQKAYLLASCEHLEQLETITDMYFQNIIDARSSNALTNIKALFND